MFDLIDKLYTPPRYWEGGNGLNLLKKKDVMYFFLPAAIFMFLFLLYPLLMLVVDSFFQTNNSNAKSFVGLDNYFQAFTSKTFIKVSVNTLIYVVVAVSLELFFGLVLAIVFSHQFKGANILRTLCLSPLMIAPLVAGLIWKFMLSDQFGIVNVLLDKSGLISSTNSILWLADERFALISTIIADVWLTTPFMMLMLFAGIQGIPNSLYEAASIEGASRMQIIFKIIIPSIKPVIISALVIRVIDAARSFDIIWAMTQGGPNFSSELLSVHIYKMLQRYGDVGYASSVAVLFIIVLITITLISMKKIWIFDEKSN